MRALIRSVGSSLADCALTFLDREPIDLNLAKLQQARYQQTLEASGVTVEVLPPLDGLPDSVFVEDAVVVFREGAILSRPGLVTRRDEPALIADAIGKYRPLHYLKESATLDGGDVLLHRRTFYIGLSQRTNQEGLDQFAQIVRPLGYKVAGVKVNGSLHLKTAVTALDDETVIANPKWIDLQSFERSKILVVDSAEPFAANTLSVAGRTFVSARSLRTREFLEKAGYATVALDISEFEKAEAGLTCLSVLFDD